MQQTFFIMWDVYECKMQHRTHIKCTTDCGECKSSSSRVNFSTIYSWSRLCQATNYKHILLFVESDFNLSPSFSLFLIHSLFSNLYVSLSCVHSFSVNAFLQFFSRRRRRFVIYGMEIINYTVYLSEWLHNGAYAWSRLCLSHPAKNVYHLRNSFESIEWYHKLWLLFFNGECS